MDIKKICQKELSGAGTDAQEGGGITTPRGVPEPWRCGIEGCGHWHCWMGWAWKSYCPSTLMIPRAGKVTRPGAAQRETSHKPLVKFLTHVLK